MSWLFGPSETDGERAARAAQERDRAQHGMRAEEWDRKVAYESDQEWLRRNRVHKQSVFETEREMARRQGREPRFYSPEEVPDLPTPAQPEPQLPWDWKGLAIRGGIFAYRKMKERRAEAAAAQQAYYAQNPAPEGTVQQGPAGHVPGPYQGFPQAPQVGPMDGQRSPAMSLVLIWASVIIGVPLATGIVGFVIYLLTMGSSSAAITVNIVSTMVNLVAWAAAILATVHIALRHSANGDPYKLAAAAKWHPLYWPRQFFAGRKG